MQRKTERVSLNQLPAPTKTQIFLHNHEVSTGMLQKILLKYLRVDADAFERLVGLVDRPSPPPHLLPISFSESSFVACSSYSLRSG